MPRSDEEVATILSNIYNAEFGGKKKQRFLISWSDIRALYGFGKLTQSRFGKLDEASLQKGLYTLDLGEGEGGHMVAIVTVRTVDRWRRVTKKIIDDYRLPVTSGLDNEEDDDE